MKEWIETRKQLLTQIKSQVDELLGMSSSQIQRLAKDYKHEFSGAWEPSGAQEILESAIETQMVIAGDFHAFAQSQRSHLRLLRAFPETMNVIVVMECFWLEHQSVLNRFVAGEISEEDLLVLTQWDEQWGFPWENYRPIVQLAIERGHRIEPLNSQQDHQDEKSVQLREEKAADHIAKLRSDCPDALIFVVFGDLHLVEGRFPKVLRSKLGDPHLRMTRVFQNSEDLYFDLAEKNMETRIDTLQKKQDTFCVLSSPPWVKWQSYLIFLEKNYDTDLEDEGDEEHLEFADHIFALIKIFQIDFHFEVEASGISVLTPESHFHEDNFQKLQTQAQDVIDYLIRSDRSWIFPELGELYLSRFSINHAAGLAGMYVHFQLMKAKEVPWDIENNFEAWIWIEAVSFFFSKWINHKRKPDTLQGIKARLHALHDGIEAKMAMVIAMEQRMREVQAISTAVDPEMSDEISATLGTLVDASKILGSILGERLYFSVKNQMVSEEKLMEWFRFPVGESGFRSKYYEIIRDLERVGVRTQI